MSGCGFLTTRYESRYNDTDFVFTRNKVDYLYDCTRRALELMESTDSLPERTESFRADMVSLASFLVEKGERDFFQILRIDDEFNLVAVHNLLDDFIFIISYADVLRQLWSDELKLIICSALRFFAVNNGIMSFEESFLYSYWTDMAADEYGDDDEAYEAELLRAYDASLVPSFIWDKDELVRRLTDYVPSSGEDAVYSLVCDNIDIILDETEPIAAHSSTCREDDDCCSPEIALGMFLEINTSDLQVSDNVIEQYIDFINNDETYMSAAVMEQTVITPSSENLLEEGLITRKLNFLEDFSKIYL